MVRLTKVCFALSILKYIVFFYKLSTSPKTKKDTFTAVDLNIYTKPRFHYGGLSFDGFIDGMEISKIETEYFKTRTEAFLKAINLANVFYNDNLV